MNRNGQTLILFLILIPILLLFAAFVIDLGIVTHEQLKLSKVTKLALNQCDLAQDSEENKKRIEKIYQENDILIEQLEIVQTKQGLRIQNSYTIESIFGKIIGLHEYLIQVDKNKEG